MSTTARVKTRRARATAARRRPTTAALLYLERDYRFWALLPPAVTIVTFCVPGAGRMKHVDEVVGEAHRPRFPRGVCHGCGCSQFDPCLTSIGPCWWVSPKRDLCSGCERRMTRRRQ